nr:MAG TPA: terminase small subunit [Caudoviricetes sp.]
METAGQRCRGHTHKKRKSNGVLTCWIFQYSIWFLYAAAFDFRSIFSKGIKETGVETVAKDGSNRGGARPGAGRKPKALTEKISEGRSAEVLMEPAELEGMDVPPVKDFLKSPQKSGRELVAEEVYRETYNWLKARNCDRLVTVQMVEQYAMSVSRWIQCEEIVSSTGFLAKHPTTGAAIASPYVAMSQSYMKQTNYCWMQIYQIVKENCSVEFSGNTPQDDVMERLLRARKGN